MFQLKNKYRSWRSSPRTVRSWIPNFFTLGSLGLAFISILICSIEQRQQHLYITSASLIILCMLLDGIDGFIARLLKVDSDIGAQLDSLADLVAFGVAPAVLMYNFILNDWDYRLENGAYMPLGMIFATIWPLCAAFRLARFNTKKSSKDSFLGLPSPAAASIVALMPIILHKELFVIPEFIPVTIYVFCAFMMVSTVHYAKPQVAIMRRFSKERLIIIICILVSILTFLGWQYGVAYAATGLFGICLVYTITGLASLLIHTIQKYRM